MSDVRSEGITPARKEKFYRADIEVVNEVSIADRRIFLRDGDIDLNTSEEIAVRVELIRALCVPRHKNKPITLHVSSPGGDVYGMFAILDYMAEAPVTINVHGRGSIMSAATFIMAAAPGLRSCSANTFFMVHEISTWAAGAVSDIKEQMEHVKALQDRALGVYEKCTDMPKEFWDRRGDFYFTAEQALDYGIIDEILVGGGRGD